MFVHLRRAKLSFHHICGTHQADAKPCEININLLVADNVTNIHQVAEEFKFNDGSLVNVTEWSWEEFSLPIINANERLQVLGKYDARQGSVNLDNVHLYTRQKCIPRWSIMKRMKFLTDANNNYWLQRSPTNRTYYGSLSLRDTEILTDKYPTTGINSVTALENCARWCLMSPACDMFEYNAGTCNIFPQENRKLLNIFDIVEEAAIGSNEAVYVLHCSATSENLVVNNDFFTQSLNPWTVESKSCDVKLSDNYDYPTYKPKHSINGWYKYVLMLTCNVDESFVMEQTISSYPWHMDSDYISHVQPWGYFRFWYNSLSSSTTATHTLTMALELMNGETLVNTLGIDNAEILNSELNNEPSMHEKMFLLPDLSTVNTFK